MRYSANIFELTIVACFVLATNSYGVQMNHSNFNSKNTLMWPSKGLIINQQGS